MSEIKHPSLKAELLYLIGRASAPLSCAELYEKCELADEVAQAAKALANLQSDGKIVRVLGEGRARYTLAAGVAAPAPAGKAGRSRAVQADDAARSKRSFITPSGEKMLDDTLNPVGPPALPVIDIPPPEEPKTMREKGKVEAAFRRAQKSTAREFAPSDASMADAIIARLKRQFGESMPRINTDLDITTAPAAITINVQRVEINLSLELGK